jgi:hypothetical protein
VPLSAEERDKLIWQRELDAAKTATPEQLWQELQYVYAVLSDAIPLAITALTHGGVNVDKQVQFWRSVFGLNDWLQDHAGMGMTDDLVINIESLTEIFLDRIELIDEVRTTHEILSES